MEEIPDEPVSPPRSHLGRILLSYGVLLLLSLIYRYLRGEFQDLNGFREMSIVLSWTTFGWARAAAEAWLVDFGVTMSRPGRSRSILRCLYVAPALFQVGKDMAELLIFRSYVGLIAATCWYLFDAALLWIGITIVWTTFSRFVRSAHLAGGDEPRTMKPTYADGRFTEDTPVPLGQGNSYLDRVIRSVFLRSSKAERAASFSLTVMLILVLVGGMASFGLWVFTHADRIATIESERNKLISLQTEMQGLRNKSDQELKDRIDRLLKSVEQYYSTSSSYEGTLNRLSTQSQTNLADIAVRVTIAVLTIFLVQVFFSVYKYNHHLASVLAAKAEALELVSNDDEARGELSHEAIAIVKESVPGFGAQPRTPYEQAAALAEKFSKR